MPRTSFHLIENLAHDRIASSDPSTSRSSFHALEEVLVRQNKHVPIDMQLSLESRKQPDVDVADAAGLLSFVSLARSADRQIPSVHIRDIKGEAGAVRAEKPANRQRVAKRRDRQVRLFGPIKAWPTLAIY